MRDPLFSHNVYHLLKAKLCTKVQYESSLCPGWYFKTLIIYHSHNNTYEIGYIETNKKQLMACIDWSCCWSETTLISYKLDQNNPQCKGGC